MTVSSVSDKKSLVRLEDVAKAANVSVATVSLALRNHHSVTEKTKQRVLQAQKELGYTPLRKRLSGTKSEQSRQQHQQTYVYCMIDLPLKQLEYNAFLSGVMHACKRRRIRLELISLSHADILTGSFLNLIPKEADGIIITGKLDQDLVDRFCAHHLKVVALGNYDLEDIHRVEIDIFKGGQTIAERIVKDGHQEIAVILGDPKNYYERQYLAGVRETLDLHQRSIPSSHVFYIDDDNLFETIADSVRKIKAIAPQVTSVISHSAKNSELFLSEYRAQTNHTHPSVLPSVYLAKGTSTELTNPRLIALNLNLEACGELAALKLNQVITTNEPVYSIVVDGHIWADKKS